MANRIDRDNTRFREIVRGRIKKELGKYISHGELIGKKGKDLISIPVPYIDIPHFRYGEKSTGGVGFGPGDVGTPIGAGPGEKGWRAGDQPGEHILEVDISLEEFVKIAFDGLELPNIELRGKKTITHSHPRYTGVRPAGPESLRHFKRTYRKALKRTIASGLYDPKKPMVVPVREDKVYRASKTILKPESIAVIIYMMDASGSMMDEQKEVVRTEVFWIDTWLKNQYDGVESAYIIHDAVAREVDQEKFYHTKESGGTIISSAYKLGVHVIQERYNPLEWNIYFFHFTDGDNTGEDNPVCVELLGKEILPRVNLFCYGQVKSPYGGGAFYESLEPLAKKNDKLVLSKIENKDGIYDSIKQFLGKRK